MAVFGYGSTSFLSTTSLLGLHIALPTLDLRIV